MAKLRNVAGSGYGSVYLDALIEGGPIWDVSVDPIYFLWGNPEDRQASYAVHGGSPYLVESGLAGRWGNCYTWWGASQYSPDEKLPIVAAVNQFEAVCGIRFDLAESWTQADMAVWKTGLPVDVWSETEKPQYSDTASGENRQSWLYLDAVKGAGETGSDVGSWSNVHPGGFGFHTILHMLGLAVGLANSHEQFPGVTGKYDIGPQGLNQVPYTVMSSNYNLRGYEQNQGKWGSMASLGAFDIAALQRLYGADTTTASGDDVYMLPTKNDRFGGWWDVVAPGWTCIWDVGGTDTISAQNSADNVVIDLRAATLIDNDPHAGGFISQQRGIAGGLTIANGVVIENAIGGSGSDVINGNSAANHLRGEAGNDVLSGGDGNDVLNGGAGADQMSGGAGDDTYYVDHEGDVINDTSGVNKIIATTGYTLNGIYVSATGGPVTVDNEAVVVTGTASGDTLIGNAKDNRLAGGKGNDVLYGGAGKDVFVFDTTLAKGAKNKTFNFDTISDFTVGEDKIWLDNAIFKKLGRKGSEDNLAVLKKKFFKIGKAKDTDDYILLNRKTGVVSYDADGSGSKKAIDFAQVTAGMKLTHDNFRII